MHKVILLMSLVIMAAGCNGPEPAAQPVRSEPLSTAAQIVPKPEPDDDRPIILAFGDSLTAGYGLPPGSGYPEQLQQALNEGGFKYRVINAGVSGETSGGGLGRLHAVLEYKPAVVILEFGANDGLQGLEIGKMRANLDEMIVALKQSRAKVILAGMTIPRNYGTEYVAAFDQVYPDLAKKHHVTLIPFFLEGTVGHPDLVLEDGLHPNRDGYRIVTAMVLKYLTPLLKTQQSGVKK